LESGNTPLATRRCRKPTPSRFDFGTVNRTRPLALKLVGNVIPGAVLPHTSYIHPSHRLEPAKVTLVDGDLLLFEQLLNRTRNLRFAISQHARLIEKLEHCDLSWLKSKNGLEA
jgi:hypothetical protein